MRDPVGDLNLTKDPDIVGELDPVGDCNPNAGQTFNRNFLLVPVGKYQGPVGKYGKLNQATAQKRFYE